ncbi:MAG: S41 family peptidase [Polyangiaceae bacterium]|jgi:hypothetical protein|nr:S41 family peptidase [Polyangiaceae bacterium]
MSHRKRYRHWRRMPGCLSAAAAIALCAAWSPPAASATFNELGVHAFDANALFTEGFEDFQPTGSMQVVQGGALEGERFLRVRTHGEEPAPVPIPVGPAQKAYRFRLFVRSSSSWYPAVTVTYPDGDGIPMSYATLYPTGVMTSDGWLELSSAPVSIDGLRSPLVTLSVTSSTVDMDALEVVEEPGGYVHGGACATVGANDCATGRLCMHGYCQDVAATVPPLPAASDRALVADVLKRKFDIFFGGVTTRTGPLREALATLDKMRISDNPWTFWNRLATAVVQLHDSHTMPFGLPNYLLRGGRAFPICMVEGDADLSHHLAPPHGQYADVLVSHVGPAKNLGLRPGDRIVAVDGMHPVQWMRSLVGLSWINSSACDPDVQSSSVEDLTAAIPAFATSIQVIRCNPSGTCSPLESILASSFERDDAQTVHPSCDHRPAYHLAQNNPDSVTHDFDDVRFGVLADSQPGEDLYGMIWNDTEWWQNTSNPWSSAYRTFRQRAKGVVLDHRTGNGGTPEGAAYLTELSLPPKTVSVWSLNTMLGLYDPPFSADDGLALFDIWRNDSARSWSVGSSKSLNGVRIAVLLARDVSGSDFFPFGVKGSPTTKLFGSKTMGAFSTFFTFETASFLGWTLASGDFVDAAGGPQIGHGVEPDEQVLPRQSDLTIGKDTAYERALAWVRCGEEVCP